MANAMKREMDSAGRVVYKFGHSVHRGGYLYAHKKKEMMPLKNKEGLRNVLSAIVKKFELIDATIKIYDTIFFLFFTMKPSVKPLDIIESIQKNIGSFAEWTNDYLYTSVYDLQEKNIRKDLRKLGFDYDRG